MRRKNVLDSSTFASFSHHVALFPISGKFNVIPLTFFPTNQAMFPLFSAKFLSILWLDRIWPFVRTIARGISVLSSPDDMKTAFLSFCSCLLTFYTRCLILLALYASCAELAWLFCCEKRAAEVNSQRSTKEASAVCLSCKKYLDICAYKLTQKLSHREMFFIRELHMMRLSFRADGGEQVSSLMQYVSQGIF